MRLHGWLILGILPFIPTPSIQAQSSEEAWVQRQVKTIQQSDTTGWDRIPWVSSLLEARRASAKEQQPLFLFTLDGNLETGRC